MSTRRQPMITTTQTRKAFLTALFLGATALVAGCANNASDDASDNGGAKAGNKSEEAVTRIAIVIDQTGSFTKYLPAAAKIIQRFVKENSVSGSAEVYLISADRSPQEIGYFPAEQLLS